MYRYKTYSENINDSISEELINDFLKDKNINNKQQNGIIGIYVYAERQNIDTRPISSSIKKITSTKKCSVCGSGTALICDHKNDLYNDPIVLDISLQKEQDFQSLCTHCNLLKRQANKREKETKKLYSAKEIPIYTNFRFSFPWEKKAYDIHDKFCKHDTYWYDPIEFLDKCVRYEKYLYPLLKHIKKVKD